MNVICSICENRSSCFNELSINELNNISGKKVEISYKKGETIIKQGASASHMYFVKKGLVKIIIENKPKNLIIELSGKGSMLGMTSINYSNNYGFSVVAINDVDVCEIDMQFINHVVGNNVGFASNIVKQLNVTINKLLKKVHCLSQKNLHSRMSEVLLELSNNVYQSTDFDMILSRNELAELTNMATENVVRTLKEFDKLGYIELKGKKVKILDIEKLKSML